MAEVKCWLLGSLVVLFAQVAAAEWSGPQPLSGSSHDARLHYNWGRSIDVDGAGITHVAWVELATGEDPSLPAPRTGRVMYARRAPVDTAFQTPIPFTPIMAFTSEPKVAAFGPHVYVVFGGLFDGTGTSRIFLKHSADFGGSWDGARIVSDNPAGEGATHPAVAAYGDLVHVVWGDWRTGTPEIFLRTSLDAGAGWLDGRQVSVNDGRSSWTPSVAAYGAQVHVAWSDERHNVDGGTQDGGVPWDCGLARDSYGCREEEYYRRLPSPASPFEDEVRLTWDPPAAPASSWAPNIAVSGGVVHVTYFDRRNGPWQIFHTRSVFEGAPGTFEADKPIASPPAGSAFARPVVAARGASVGVTFYEVANGVGSQAYFAESSNGGASFPSVTPVTPVGAAELHSSLAVSPVDGSFHLIWYDFDASGVTQVFYRSRP